MSLELGARLAIMFPTILFLLGFVYKAIIQNKTLKLKHSAKNRIRLNNDFIMVLAIDSILLSIANGLILIFTFESLVWGILSIIIGFCLSMFYIVGVYAKSPFLIVGFGVFSLLTAELGYFLAYGYGDALEFFSVFLGLCVGFFLGLFIIFYATPSKP